MHIFGGFQNMLVLWFIFLSLLRKMQNTRKNATVQKIWGFQNGNFFISSDAELSSHSEYYSHITPASFLIGKKAKNAINSWFPQHFLALGLPLTCIIVKQLGQQGRGVL
jgi:hypothetical protein